MVARLGLFAKTRGATRDESPTLLESAEIETMTMMLFHVGKGRRALVVQ